MSFRKFKIWILALLVIGVLLGINLSIQNKMDKIITQEKLVDEAVNDKGLPPMVAFTTVALGGFRGILADLLWLRAGTLQEEGKYFELVQLASWITKLQPKFTGAISFLAWNMSYNISVTFQDKQDRWRWVQRGIELIRDEGLNYNANDPKLYQQLGWIYQHKMGNTLDDAQKYYKYQIAKEMQVAFGGVPDPDWEALNNAPRSFIEFRRKNSSNSFWNKIQSAGYRDDESLNRAFRKTGQLPESLKEALSDEEALELETFLRAIWLRDHYKIRPEVVIEINKKYGKLDWRASESHAIYWATLGNMYSPNRFSIECDRMITQSLKESFIGGRMLFPEKTPSEDFIMVPNLELADAVRESFLLAAERNDFAHSFKSALDNYMIDAIVILYSYGREKKAREYFNIMRKERVSYDKRFLNFEQFIVSQWEEDMKDGSYKQAHDLISGLIYTAAIYIAYDDSAAGEAHLKLAQMAHDRYSRSFKDVERMHLPPFGTMKREIVLMVMKNFPKLAPRLNGVIQEEKSSD
ncbi:MAG: hypothetical protein E7040_03855 [Lentisphaerae bacterium]|nr:hypothetical protein [Lentisphaerota bacterium]